MADLFEDERKFLDLDREHLAHHTAEMLGWIDEMIGQAKWRGDDVNQLREDIISLATKIEALADLAPDFMVMLREHLVAHQVHMKLARRFEGMLDRDLEGKRK